MTRKLSVRELAIIAIILDEEEKTENGGYWVHKAFRNGVVSVVS